jgi:hypothetical protein
MGHFPPKIVSATDGSEDVTLAAWAAADLTNRSGSEGRLVHHARCPLMAMHGG